MKKVWLIGGLMLGAVLTLNLAACQPETESEQVEVERNPTFIDAVEVEERDGEYKAIVEGWYPDACSTYGGDEQKVEGSTIDLVVYSQRPVGLACAQMLTAMTEEILLETDGLSSGEYLLEVNMDQAQTTFVIS